MDSSNLLLLEGHRMLQIGIALFIFTGLEGFVIPALRAPHLGRSAHTLSALQGVIILALGLIWPKLNLGATASQIAFWTFLYSSFATLIPFVLAAIWRAGNTTFPMAAREAHGSALQETIIKVIQYSAALPFFVSMALILWGLRVAGAQ